MGFTIQQPGSITFVIECDPSWTPCEKQQVKQKADELNARTPVSRDPAYSAAKRDQGDRCAAAWRRAFNSRRAGRNPAPSPLLGNDPNCHPNGGTESDFAHACMKDEFKELEPAAQDDYIKSCQPDHTMELQFAGGAPQGPMALMSGRVNGSLGSQLSNSGYDSAGQPAPVDHFETMGCD
ncbi:MAG TPA: hypothetical protein VMI75_12590 [Polyangiaceae bacterium]|nr:hypothetical protein [Polyangiaceae bacterium]